MKYHKYVPFWPIINLPVAIVRLPANVVPCFLESSNKAKCRYFKLFVRASRKEYRCRVTWKATVQKPGKLLCRLLLRLDVDRDPEIRAWSHGALSGF